MGPDPRIAIAAMQAMNGSVRNIVFAPAFFGTPFALGMTAIVLLTLRQGKSATAFGLSTGVYFLFGMVLTMMVNVPMNEALAVVVVPEDIEAARKIWTDYSQPWQVWNQTRMLASGTSFLLAVYGVILFNRSQK